jgi:hypothetical protein
VPRYAKFPFWKGKPIKTIEKKRKVILAPVLPQGSDAQVLQSLDDPAIFLRTYGVVKTQYGLEKIKLWPWQEKYLGIRASRVIHAKSREIGSSTIVVLKEIHRSLFDGGDVLIAADKEENAKNLLGVCKTFVSNLPFQVPIGMDNQTQFEVLGTSRRPGFKVTAISRPLSARFSTAGRSERCLRLIITEMAFWVWADDYFTSVTGALVAGGSVVIESTFNGIGNLFHRMWKEALEGVNGYIPVMNDFHANPNHDAVWEAQRRLELPPWKFAEEYGCDPRQSGRPYFDDADLQLRVPEPNNLFCQTCLQEDPECLKFDRDTGYETEKGETLYVTESVWKYCAHRDLKIYQAPRPETKYILFADSATGKRHGSFCCGTMVRIDDGQEVAHLHGRWKPDVFGQKIDALARAYMSKRADGTRIPCRVIIERNHPGPATIAECKRLKTPGLYKDPNDHDYGWLTTGTSRPAMFTALEQSNRLKEVSIATPETLDEMRAMQTNDAGEPEAPEGYTDDRAVVSAGMARARLLKRPDLS